MPTFYKIALSLLLLISGISSALGTHNRAGEITYKHISGYTFEFTVTTYTYAPSKANRDYIYVSWGDETSDEVKYIDRLPLPNDYLRTTYTTTHTFPGPGTYQILMEDPNRNLGVKNIPNSVNTIFSIKTTMLIGTYSGTNTTPVLLNPPVDNAARNHIFIHNPAAYDADGDSISYQLTVCTAEKGTPIEGYTYPPSSDTLFIDSYYGDLTWITPVDTGVYNIAIFIDEWRDNVKIGRITRDMQIDVYDTDNNPPVNDPIANYCVEAGQTIEFYVTSTDIDNDPIEQELASIPVANPSPTIDIVEAGAGFSTSKFTWETNCAHARQQPYTLVFKSTDVVNDVNLTDITSFYIRVLPSAPTGLTATAGYDNIDLSWEASTCGNPTGYRIYRRAGSYNFTPDSCENGVPEYTGFSLLDVVYGNNILRYNDDNLGQGLVPGFDYCYMITAIYNDGVESFASEEVCTSLIPGIPSILQVSVQSDHAQTGEILVSWAMPKNFDTIDDGPYRYEVYRMAPNEEDYSLVGTIPTADLSDTSFLNTEINTLIYPYFYNVRLLYQEDDNSWTLHPGSEIASSLFMNLKGVDNAIEIDIQKRSPWLNYSYDIFRKKELDTNFDSITTVTQPQYTDENIPNLVPYTYRTVSKSLRPLNDIDFYTDNISHINTTSAYDSFPPCAPSPEVISICDSSYNIVSWNSSKTICGDDDVINYLLYYKPTLEGSLQLIETLGPNDTIYTHRIGLESLAGVYGVVAVDSFQNMSSMNTTMIDSCHMFSLPNVFTPNNDGVNDIYVSYNLGGFVKKVDMTIFNRYGQPVYKTNDPDINWNGQDMDSKKTVSTGVYYYICDVYEPRLTGEEHFLLKGFIHVYSNDEIKPNE